jgi:hypothetical protein
MSTLNGDAFERMCAEDAEWLERIHPGNSLEKEHILSILRTCRRYYYSPSHVWDAEHLAEAARCPP